MSDAADRFIGVICMNDYPHDVTASFTTYDAAHAEMTRQVLMLRAEANSRDTSFSSGERFRHYHGYVYKHQLAKETP